MSRSNRVPLPERLRRRGNAFHCIALLRAVLCTLLCVLCFEVTARGATANPSSVAVGRVGPPPSLPPVEATPPRLPGPEHARRPWLVASSVEFVQHWCPGWVEVCPPTLGWALGLALFQRPKPSFSWGPVLHLASVPRRYRVRNTDYREHVTEGAVLLAARLWGSEAGPLDPFVQVASGVARLDSRSRVGSAEWEIEQETSRFAPIYAVQVGVDLHLTEHVRAGAVLGWTHRLTEWRRACPDGFVDCIGDEAGYFSMANAIWGGGLQLSTAFGDPL